MMHASDYMYSYGLTVLVASRAAPEMPVLFEGRVPRSASAVVALAYYGPAAVPHDKHQHPLGRDKAQILALRTDMR
jgi:hypothetical protein